MTGLIVQQGQINTTALLVPNLIVQEIPPQYLLNGVPTNVVGVVGTAQYGPVNAPVVIGTMANYQTSFGSVQNRTFDMGTIVSTAMQQGANNFRCVRVTDGTDTAATIVVQSTCITFTARYTGSLGNSITVQVTSGSAANSYRVIVSLPNALPEIFDNITGSGNALWVAVASAVNNGNTTLRGPSQVVSAAAGAGTTTPTLTTYTLAGGTDGATSVTPTTLLGSDSATPRTGMYALRGQGCSIGVLAADTVDTSSVMSSTWTTQLSFAESEGGIYMIICGPQSDTISNAASTLATAGVANFDMKELFGDWCYWNDTTNSVIRLVPPQGFIAGLLSNLAPNQSTLNKQLNGILGTQKTGLPGSGISQTYAQADLQSLASAGIDVITNPAPGGNYWAARIGCNTSNSAVTSDDSYTRMENYIAQTLAAGMGIYIGKPITTLLFNQVKATLVTFLQTLVSNGLLDATYGTPYSVVCNTTNNPQSQTALNYVRADVQVRFEGINKFFLINLQGGSSVAIQSSNTPFTV